LEDKNDQMAINLQQNHFGWKPVKQLIFKYDASRNLRHMHMHFKIKELSVVQLQLLYTEPDGIILFAVVDAEVVAMIAFIKSKSTTFLSF
jgi:hypothetical protein